jgi:hypothetical protein
MTAAEWLACTDPVSLWSFFQGKTSDRKKRLFAVACCRYIWRWLSDERCKLAVEAAELYADGIISHRQLSNAMNEADAVSVWGEESVLAYTGYACFNAARCEDRPGPYDDYGSAATFALDVIRQLDKDKLDEAVLYQCNVFRDVVGNPFSSVPVNQSWLASRVKRLAQGTYDSKDFNRLPILADALEDAGCTNADILSHCRGPGPHVRGCWVVDLLLGRS